MAIVVVATKYLAECLFTLTQARLPPEATFPFSSSSVSDGKLVMEAPTVEEGKAWASRIREELAPGAKVGHVAVQLLCVWGGGMSG